MFKVILRILFSNAGADPGFSPGGGGGTKDYAHAHHEREARYDVPYGHESSRGFWRSPVLSEPYFKHSDTKLDTRNTVDKISGGGGGSVATPLNPPLQ